MIIGTLIHNFIKNYFHSPLFKFSVLEDYFQIIHDDKDVELIFKSDLHFMCIYTCCTEIYCFQGNTAQLLLIKHRPFSKRYECRWITTQEIAHDRAYFKISEKAFNDFASRYAKLNWMMVRNSAPQFYTL